MRRQIVTAGTQITDFERKYVVEAVSDMGDPDHFKDYVYMFEKEFAKKIGVRYAFAVTNGTAALHLGLLALGVGQGDEVILPDMTYIACANVIRYVGATPVFVDIDPYTWCIDPDCVRNAITKKTKAIMPVWMYGSVPNMDAIKELGVPVIEDSCPAFGSYYKGKHAGTIGDVGAFSFQGAKILAVGEGGMFVTNSKKLNDRARKLADMGITKKQFWHDEIGYMYEMAPILAAVGLGQLKHSDEMVRKKKKIFGWYEKMIGDLFHMNSLFETPNYWMTSITADNRDDLRKRLSRKGIDTRPFFYPISSFALYQKRHNTPVSYAIGLNGINLPSRVDLTYKEVSYVCEIIKKSA